MEGVEGGEATDAEGFETPEFRAHELTSAASVNVAVNLKMFIINFKVSSQYVPGV